MYGTQQTRAVPGQWLALLALVAAFVAALSVVSPARADAPTITSVDPAVGSAAGGTTVTITGTNFGDVDEAVVAIEFGGTPVTSFNVIDDTTISVTTPAHAPGLVDIELTVDGTVVEEDAFTYHPVVTSVNPPSGPNTGGTTVTITGAGFAADSTVEFDGASVSPTMATPTQMTVTTPVHTSGTVDVVVTTNGISSPPDASGTFTFGDAPTITEIDPDTGPTGGGTGVVITGTNLAGATSVTFGGNAGTITGTTATTINVTTPAHAAGAVDVVVTTPSGTVTLEDGFTYEGAGTVPSVTGLDPDTGPTVGGTVVVITGTNFTGATGVSFGGTAATQFTVDSATQITAVSPAHAAGDVNVQVSTPAGTSQAGAANVFTYVVNAGPLVTGLNPTGGPTAGGNTVVITGTGFTGATAVSFGNTAATSFTVDSDTQITATAPSRPAGAVFVTVTTPEGTSGPQAAALYTYGELPVITGINPTSGPATGGTEVTITGTGFTGATAVHFGTVAATDFDVVSDTEITATSPAGTAGTVFIRVTTPTGQSAEVAAAQFTYTSQGATVTYTLHFRWTLLVWQGQNGISISTALAGTESPDDPDTNDISGRVTAIFRWNATSTPQRWEAFFPNAGNVPGANDFTTFETGRAYFIAITSPGPITWTIRAGS